MGETRELRLTVAREDGGLPVRRLALERLRMSYGQFKRAKFQGELLLDGRPVHADARAQEGQTLVIRVPEKATEQPCEPVPIPFRVAYEDEDCLIVDKPAPLPSICSRRQDGATLENAVCAYWHAPEGFLYRPVNRLDKGTSGLMVVAKHAHAQQFLQAELHTDAFVREYLAVCEGEPPSEEGWIDLPIGKAEGATIRRETRSDGRPARTRYRLLERGAGRCLLRLRLDTGRTHQIRVHLRAVGCPVTGDFLYGRECEALPGRFALHSCYLRMESVRHGVIERESPLPAELRALLIQK